MVINLKNEKFKTNLDSSSLKSYDIKIILMLLKKYLNKLEKKLQTSVKYLSYIDYAVSFRKAIQLQVNQLAKAIEMEDASFYEPVRIR